MAEKQFHITMRAAEDGDPLEYVMSDESVDRYGDVIKVDGWDLGNFRKNPIALFGHNSSKPIGKWSNVRIEKSALRGRLELAPPGTSPEIDTYRALIAAGVLRAVSVGFIPVDYDIRRDKEGGYEGVVFTKSELVETSLVAVPANPNALQIAKALDIPREQLTRIFGDPAAGLTRTRALTGEPADLPPKPKKGTSTMSTLAQRIQAVQQGLAAKHERLAAIAASDTIDATEMDAVTKEIEGDEANLGSLQRAEAVLARQSVALNHSTALTLPEVRSIPGASQQNLPERRPFAQPKEKEDAVTLLIRALAIRVIAKVTGDSTSNVMAERYGDMPKVREVLQFIQRAASAPATTTTTGWAAELVQTAVLDFLDALQPDTIYPRLRDMGARFNFGRNGVVSLPSRAATPTIAGSFVAQGGAIPVRQGAFNAITLTPKKMAVISTFTREIAEHSTPNIEAIIRQMINEDTSASIDSVLLDATAASATRPAGLRAGVSTLTPTAGANLDALIADLKQMLGVLIAANALRAPVWIMNPAQALSISLRTNANGEFVFRDEVAAGRLLTYPILTSTSVTAAQVFLVDAADFFSATGDEPRFDVNDSATLHMEDTAPTAIGTTGTPTVVAAPVRSLWQTDTIGIRMIMDLNWALRRTGIVSYITAVTW